jgi:uncharacterized membrane protein YfcA
LEISIFNIFQFALIGTAVGFLGGFLGVGGGAILIPLLNYWVFPSMGVSPEVIIHLCFGTSLAIIIPTSISGSWAHTRAGNINWHVVYLLAVPGILGSFLGSTFSAHLKGSVLQTLFGVILISISAHMFFQKEGLEESEPHFPPQTFPTVIVGLLVGLFSGFFGLGGGVLVIPLMVRVLRIPIHRALGVSIAFVFFASLVGTAGYVIHGWGNPYLPPHTLGYVHVLGWVLAGIPSMFLSNWGVQLARKTRPLRLRRVFALMLMVMGIRMVFWNHPLRG